ncbi:NrdH-like glutaredoxin [Mycobacterium phage JackSparrow]|nr:NrdH-like glutaredoxin [Mycobacterium phage JackSparrow]
MPDNLIRNELGVTVYSTEDQDPEALKLVKQKGYETAPVVHVASTGAWWDDFRADKIRDLIKAVKA